MNATDAKFGCSHDGNLTSLTMGQNRMISGPLGKLPEELLIQVIANLKSAQAIACLGETCYGMNQLTKDEGGIWKPLFHLLFPSAVPTKSLPSGQGYFDLFKERIRMERNLNLGLYKEQTLKCNKDHFQVVGDHVYIASGKIIKIWDMANGGWHRTFEGHGGMITRFRVVGRLLYTVSAKTIKIWDATNGTCLQTFEGRQGMVTRFRVDGTRLYAVSAKAIEIWDTTIPRCLHTLPNHQGQIAGIQAVNDRLYTLSAKTIEIWDTIEGTSLDLLTGDRCMLTHIQVIGNRLYMVSVGGIIEIWDTKDRRCIHKLQGHRGPINCLQVVQDRLYTCSNDKTIKIWDTITGECLGTLIGSTTHPVTFLEVDGDRLYTVSQMTIKIWDTTTQNCLHTIEGHQGPITLLKIVKGRLYMDSAGTIKIRDYAMPCPSSYSLRLLNENLAILAEMASSDADPSLIEKLYPNFKQRLEEFSIKPGTSSSFSKHEISHVQAELYVEVLLHALYNGNSQKVYEILGILHSISDQHTAKLFEILTNECGKNDPLTWGKNAFYDAEGYNASLYAKIQATLKFNEILKSVI